MQLPIELSDPVYHDEEAARSQLESIRWPDGPFCPYCGSFDRVKPTVTPNKAHGGGWHRCQDCRRNFTVRVGSIFHRSHVPLYKWLLGFRLMAGSKTGISAHQLHRTLKIDYKSAWFLEHRIREAMKDTDPTPLGGEGKTLESDETYYGKNPNAPEPWVFKSGEGWKRRQRRGHMHLLPILTLIERGGKARSVRITDVKADTIRRVLAERADNKSALMTDELMSYRRVGKRFARHESVNHKAEEYARGEAHVNNAEAFFSVFKRGMSGIYQHCDEKHLHRYLAEFDFRYSHRSALGIEDAERAAIAIKGAAGKRLLYKQSHRSYPE